MSRTPGTISLVGALLFSVLLPAGGPSTALAAETSGCVACHLDEAMLVKNLGGTKARRSAMQSGAG
jgi:hypothetical protein